MTERQGQRQQHQETMAKQRQQFAENSRHQNWNHHHGDYDDWGHYGGWGNDWWAPVALTGVTSFFGAFAGSAIGNAAFHEPSYVSYGSGYSEPVAGESVTYNSGDTVVVNGESGSSQQYADQANAIASNYDSLTADMPPPEPGTSVATEDWLPLGLYALTPDGGGDATQYYQLMVNKKGAISGVFHDLTNDTSTPIEGAVDPKTKIAAWKVAGSTNTTETGFYNLTEPQTDVLIHDGNGSSKQVLLVRIEQPSEGA